MGVIVIEQCTSRLIIGVYVSAIGDGLPFCIYSVFAESRSTITKLSSILERVIVSVPALRMAVKLRLRVSTMEAKMIWEQKREKVSSNLRVLECLGKKRTVLSYGAQTHVGRRSGSSTQDHQVEPLGSPLGGSSRVEDGRFRRSALICQFQTCADPIRVYCETSLSLCSFSS